MFFCLPSGNCANRVSPKGQPSNPGYFTEDRYNRRTRFPKHRGGPKELQRLGYSNPSLHLRAADTRGLTYLKNAAILLAPGPGRGPHSHPRQPRPRGYQGMEGPQVGIRAPTRGEKRRALLCPGACGASLPQGMAPGGEHPPRPFRRGCRLPGRDRALTEPAPPTPGSPGGV